MSNETKRMLYVGTMNDGLFIIDQPPHPAPNDAPPHVDEKPAGVVAKMVENSREAGALAQLFAASPEMYEALNDALRMLEAVRLSAGLGKKQLERLAKHQAVLAHARGETG